MLLSYAHAGFSFVHHIVVTWMNFICIAPFIHRSLYVFKDLIKARKCKCFLKEHFFLTPCALLPRSYINHNAAILFLKIKKNYHLYSNMTRATRHIVENRLCSPRWVFNEVFSSSTFTSAPRELSCFCHSSGSGNVTCHTLKKNTKKKTYMWWGGQCTFVLAIQHVDTCCVHCQDSWGVRAVDRR